MKDYVKSLKKLLNNILSTKNIGLTIFFLTWIMLTVLLASNYYLFQNIIENDISKIDVIATKTIQVIDDEKTKDKKQEAAQKIEPIFRPAQDSINDYIRKNLIELLNSIVQVRESNQSSLVKQEKIEDLLDISQQDYITGSAVAYLYKCSRKNFDKVSNKALISLNLILNKGVSEEKLQDNTIIQDNIDKSLSKTQQKALNLVIGKIILPNMVVDELATNIVRKNASHAVDPILVTFKKGDKIVSAGDIVAKPQKTALKKLGYNVLKLNFLGIIGILSLVGVCLYTIAYYLINFDPKYLTPSYLSLISLLSMVIIASAALSPISVYLIPIPAIAILLTIFTNSRISLLVTSLVIIIMAIALQYKIETTFVFIVGSTIATFASSKINYYRRIDMVKAGFNVGIIQAFIILGIYSLQNGLIDINSRFAFAEFVMAFVNGLASGIIVLGTLPLIENVFKIITPYGLAELADHNQALLKRLQFEAPGTYHHSLMVSNLAESAAEAIGANPVLARVGAFYHDIGKLKRPLFFVENQSYFGIENPHEKLNPRLSKMIVTAHPKDGLELAKEYDLPNIVHQFIMQHHGNGLAIYFYNQALATEGAENITKEQFRYSCPKPNSKEAAILMIADAVESAVRSIKTPTPSDIEGIIDKIVNERLYDGQLTESPLTLKDIKTITLTFNRILRGMQHHRIKYHENVIEELSKKTGINNTMIQNINNIEKEFALKKEENKKND